jgi:hypothetical protein
MRTRRHWVRGIVGGLLLGLGFAVGSIVYSFNAFGVLTPWILVVLGLVIGVLVVFVPSRKARRARAAIPPEVYRR